MLQQLSGAIDDPGVLLDFVQDIPPLTLMSLPLITRLALTMRFAAPLGGRKNREENG